MIDTLKLFAKWPCCRCTTRDGWTLDVTSGYWVCNRCRRPSNRLMEQCENCNKWWLPAAITAPEDKGTLACPECLEKLGL